MGKCIFFGGKLQIDAKNSNFEILESALYMKLVSMPISEKASIPVAKQTRSGMLAGGEISQIKSGFTTC